MLAVFCGGLACGIAWAANQAAVPPPPAAVIEPARPPEAQVAIVLVASDGSAVAEAIDRASGRGGFSHVYIDAGAAEILDYRPGAGVHWAPRDTYRERGVARIELRGRAGEQLYGCARARLGQHFDAAGLVMGTSSIANCTGLVYGCLPLELRDQLGGAGRPVAPNDLARLFGARINETVTWSEES